MRSSLRRRYGFLLLLLLLCVLAFCAFLRSRDVYADGGAPNLAYVSGTSSGISVIDVGQAKVTKIIPVIGDPHAILLSLDGSALYVTQPTSGQVSILAAKTGRLICTAHLGGTPTLLALDPNRETIPFQGQIIAVHNS